jgi:NAD(P)-dependent dehydrogenase (short-subunit alcohol dehydrogenase family)
MTVMVLGGTRGIGLAISKEFAARGRFVRRAQDGRLAALDAPKPIVRNIVGERVLGLPKDR